MVFPDIPEGAPGPPGIPEDELLLPGNSGGAVFPVGAFIPEVVSVVFPFGILGGADCPPGMPPCVEVPYTRYVPSPELGTDSALIPDEPVASTKASLLNVKPLS